MTVDPIPTQFSLWVPPKLVDLRVCGQKFWCHPPNCLLKTLISNMIQWKAIPKNANVRKQKLLTNRVITESLLFDCPLDWQIICFNHWSSYGDNEQLREWGEQRQKGVQLYSCLFLLLSQRLSDYKNKESPGRIHIPFHYPCFI